MTTDNKKKQYIRSKEGVVSSIIGNQKRNSIRRGQNPPSYSTKELKDWLFSQPLFHRLYEDWKRLDCLKLYKPSIDRIDDNIGYTITNIQLMTWAENKAKGHKDMRSGKIKHGTNPQKKVLQHSIDGEFVAEFVSANEASRKTNISQGSISDCCRGYRNVKQAGGYKWIYKKDIENFTKMEKHESPTQKRQ